MKKQDSKSSVKLVKLSLFQLKKIKGRGTPAIEDIEGEQGKP